MPKPTGYKLNDYIKAVEICVAEFGYDRVKHGYVSGSAYTFQIFERGDQSVPCVIWSIHFGHNKKKEIYSDDLKKIWTKTMVTKERFIEVLQALK